MKKNGAIRVLSINKQGNKVVSYTCINKVNNFKGNIYKDELVGYIKQGMVENASVQVYKGQTIVRVKDADTNVQEKPNIIKGSSVKSVTVDNTGKEMEDPSTKLNNGDAIGINQIGNIVVYGIYDKSKAIPDLNVYIKDLKSSSMGHVCTLSSNTNRHNITKTSLIDGEIVWFTYGTTEYMGICGVDTRTGKCKKAVLVKGAYVDVTKIVKLSSDLLFVEGVYHTRDNKSKSSKARNTIYVAVLNTQNGRLFLNKQVSYR